MNYDFKYFGTIDRKVEVGDMILAELILYNQFMGMNSELLWFKINYVNKDGTCTSTLLSNPDLSCNFIKTGDRVNIGIECIKSLKTWNNR